MRVRDEPLASSRRAFLRAAAALGAGGALGARGKPPRVIVLTSLDESERAFLTAHYRTRFALRGWVDGERVALHIVALERPRHVADAQIRAAILARPDVIIVAGVENARFAHGLTKDIPIVFMEVAQPVEAGLVASMRRPGGNVTGASSRSAELIGKRIELLRELAPHARRVTLLRHEGGFAIYPREAFAAPARALGLALEDVVAVKDAEATVSRLAAARAEACYCFLGFAGSGIMAPLLRDARKRRGTLALLGAAATAIVGQGEYFTYMHAHAR